LGISKCTTLVSGQFLSSGGTFLKLPIIAIGSGWDKLVLSVVEGFSEPTFVFVGWVRKMLP